MSTATDDKAATVASTLRAVAAAIDEGQPVTSGAFLSSLADLLDGSASIEDDEEPTGDVEQEAPAVPTFAELLARNGGWTVMLESPPLIQDMPIPGEHRDASADLADMFLETRAGIRTELPAYEGLPIPDLDPARESIGIELTLEGMPLPADTIQQSSQLMLEPMARPRPMAVRVNTEPSGEFAGGMPLPKF